MDVDPQEQEQHIEADEVAQDQAQGASGRKEKKKKIRPYHRIHAHRNPLSDAPME
jgi:hypothetical protein